MAKTHFVAALVHSSTLLRLCVSKFDSSKDASKANSKARQDSFIYKAQFINRGRFKMLHRENKTTRYKRIFQFEPVKSTQFKWGKEKYITVNESAKQLKTFIILIII